MFSGSGNSMALLVMFYLETGSQICKMVTDKPEVPVSQLLYKIAKKSQLLSACFWGQRTQWRYREGFILKLEVRYSRWRRQTGSTFISASIQDSKEIPIAICMFLGSENTMAISRRLHLETGSQIFKIAAPNRKYLYLSLYTR
jgi:hypothetical protein